MEPETGPAWPTPDEEQPGQCQRMVDTRVHGQVGARSGLASGIRPPPPHPGSLLASVTSRPRLPRSSFGLLLNQRGSLSLVRTSWAPLPIFFLADYSARARVHTIGRRRLSCADALAFKPYNDSCTSQNTHFTYHSMVQLQLHCRISPKFLKVSSEATVQLALQTQAHLGALQ